MGISVFPAATAGGGGAPFPNAGELVSSGTMGTKGFFLSDVLPAGNYIIAADGRNVPNTSEQSYISVNAPGSGVWEPVTVTDSSDGVRVKLTQSERIAVALPWYKAGAEYGATDNISVLLGLGGNWQSMTYNNNKFYGTDKYFTGWRDSNNSTSNRVAYHDLTGMTTLNAQWREFGALANIDDAVMGGNRPHTAGGIVGNFAYFSFTQSTGAQRIWRANLSTPNTWTVGTTAATTDGFVTGIAFGASTYVLVTSTGNINTSPDFATWTKQTSPVTSIRDITFANGQFVVVGLNGDIATSSNGFTWTKRTAPAGVVHFYNVNYIGSQYVAIGGQTADNVTYPWYGILGGNPHARSSDGITWTSFDLQTTTAAATATNTNKYSSYQQIRDHNYQNDINRSYGCNSSYVYNGYLYVDIAPDKKFFTADGTTWYCMYQFWANRRTITSTTHGMLDIDINTYAGERPGLNITGPQIDARVFIYAERD